MSERTTLTLEDDVAVMLHNLQEQEQKTFKETVNEVLRIGLIMRNRKKEHLPQYSTPTLSLGVFQYSDVDSIHDILEAAEGDFHDFS